MKRILIGVGMVLLVILGGVFGYSEYRYGFSVEGINKKLFLVKPKLLMYDWLLTKNLGNKFNFAERIELKITDQKQFTFWLNDSAGETVESVTFDKKTYLSKVTIQIDNGIVDEVNVNNDYLRLDGDILGYLCLRDIKKETLQSRGDCLKKAYLIRKSNNLGRFLYVNKVNLLSEILKPSPVLAGCGGSWGCGTWGDNCTCSSGGGCSLDGAFCGPGNLGKCSCVPICGSFGSNTCSGNDKASCEIKTCNPGMCVHNTCGWVDCPAYVACPTGCGSPGSDRADGNCGTHWCDATPACCSWSPGSWHATCNTNTALGTNCGRSCDGGSCPANVCSGTMPTCLVNGTWTGWSPDDCNNKCGQTVTRSCPAVCGGSCPNDGNGASKVCATTDSTTPGTVTITSPAGTAGNPTIVTNPATLTWNNNEANHTPYTDSYEYRVFDITANSSLVGIADQIVWDASSGTWMSVPGSGVNAGGAGVFSLSQGSLISGHSYYWDIRAVNTTCAGNPAGTTYGGWSNQGYFKINTPPTYTTMTLKNSLGVIATPDANSRNHICESVFTAGGANGQQTYFEVYANDLDGPTDITSIAFRIRTDVGAIASYTANFVNGVLTGIPVTSGWSYVASSGNSTGIGFLVQMNNSIYGTNMYHMEANITDKWGASTGWVDTTRDFKIWDCNVNVNGTIYDGSPIISCPATGFSNLAPASMNFTSLAYGGINMTVNPPATYSGGPLTWGKTYLINFNGDIEATGRVMRGRDHYPNKTWCNDLSVVLDQTRIDAYQGAVPIAVIDYSFIRNQEGWYQTVGGGIEARNTINSAVPVTCSGACVPGLAINSVGVSNDGLVAALNLNITSGCSSDTCLFSSPRNTSVGTTVMYEKYSYEKIKNNYWGRLGLGTTLTGDKTLAEVITAKGTDGVVFVEGNVNVTANNLVPVGSFLMVVASGAITFDPAVTTAQGIFIANGAISASGTNNTALSISGMLYTLRNISFTRAFTVGSSNNTLPAVLVTYRPDFIFNSPPALASEISWKY